MPISFDQYFCLDALQEAENITRLGIPAPANMGRANSLFNPLGQEEARGWFLLLRRDINAMNQDGRHSITFDSLALGLTTLYGLYVVKGTQLTSGAPGDPNASYLVEVADGRYLLNDRNLGADFGQAQQFNVRAPAYGLSYYAGTAQSTAAPLRWLDILKITWASLSKVLGTFPGMPPDVGLFPPENLSYPGVNAWQSLCHMLAVLGCAVKCDLSAITDQYSIVSVGGPDKGFSAYQQQLAKANAQIHDADFREVPITRQPAGVAVCFHRAELAYSSEQTHSIAVDQWMEKPLAVVHVPNPNAAANAPYSHVLWESALADVAADGKAVVNQTVLKQRAQIRANDFFRSINMKGGGRLHRVYSGARGFQPGALCKGVSWFQDTQGIGNPEQPGGIATAIYNHPYLNMRVLDDGKAEWCSGFEDSTNFHPPDFRPTWPIYPPQAKVVEVSGAAGSLIFPDPDKLFGASLLTANSVTGSFSATEPDAAFQLGVEPSSGQAIPNRFPGILVGNKNGRPVWAFRGINVPWQAVEALSGTVSVDGGTVALGRSRPGMFGQVAVIAIIQAACNTAAFVGLFDALFDMNIGANGLLQQVNPDGPVFNYNMIQFRLAFSILGAAMGDTTLSQNAGGISASRTIVHVFPNLPPEGQIAIGGGARLPDAGDSVDFTASMYLLQLSRSSPL